MFKGKYFLKGISKNVFILSITSFFTDVSSEMLYPVIPIFITSVLGAPMFVVGLIEGIAESTASILKVISGWLSDKIHKRGPFVIGGYSVSSMAKPLLFLAYSWPVVLLARFLDRFGKGLRTSARDAMITDSSEAVYRGRAFGFHRATDTLGACIGPLLAIWFLYIFKGNLRLIFLIAFIPALLAVFTLIFFLKEAPVIPEDKNKSVRFNLKDLGGNFNKFLFATAIFSIGNSSDAFLILRAKDLGFSLTVVILAYILYNVSYSLLSTPFGILSDRIPRKNIMIIGYVIFAVVYAGFGLIKNSAMIWPLFFTYGFYMAMTDGVGKALASDMVKKEYVGTALGFYHFALGIFAFFASLIAGLLWSCFGAVAPFLYGASTAILSGIALIILVK